MKRLVFVVFFIGCAGDVVRTEPSVQSKRVTTEAAPAPSAIHEAVPPTAVLRSRRNLFAYYEPPQAPVRTMTMISAVPPPVVFEMPPAVEVAAPKPPQFPWRYIGRFGPANDPIAAFIRGDDVRTVRPGDRIDEQFVLRSIGLETVEVEAGGWAGEPIVVALSTPI